MGKAWTENVLLEMKDSTGTELKLIEVIDDMGKVLVVKVDGVEAHFEYDEIMEKIDDMVIERILEKFSKEGNIDLVKMYKDLHGG